LSGITALIHIEKMEMDYFRAKLNREVGTRLNEKSVRRRRKHCALAVV